MAKSSQGKEPVWWPRDPHGYIFLARVVEKIGAALNDDWTGTEAETITDDIDSLPRDLKDATPFNKRQAEDLLRHHCPGLARSLGGWREFSEKDWKIAYDLLRDQVAPALHRLHKTLSEIVKRNETGEIELRIQSRNAGPWRDFNKDWWNTDQWRSHFIRCRIDPDYPKGDRPSWMRSDNDHWIFAPSAGVEQVLEDLRGKRGGRKPFPYWQILETKTHELMDDNGLFMREDPKWNAQARLEEALQKICREELGCEPPSLTQLRNREHIPKWLEDWRAAKRNRR